MLVDVAAVGTVVRNTCLMGGAHVIEVKLHIICHIVRISSIKSFC